MASTNYIVKLFGDPTPFYYYIVQLCGAGLGMFSGVAQSTEILQVGDTALLTVDGLQLCGEIIRETTETVDAINIIKTYRSCNECIACNGTYYFVQICNTEDTLTIFSYSYYQPGEYLQIGYYCCQVITSFPFVEEFDVYVYSAPLCDGCNPTKNVWLTSSCFGGVPPVLVYADTTLTTGDTVSVGVYGLGFDCVILQEYIPSEDLNPFFTTFIDSKNHQDCSHCSVDTYFFQVVQFVKCSDPETIMEGIFTFLAVGNFSNDYNFFSFGGPECYIAVDINPEVCGWEDYPRYSPSYFYQSCEECNQPLSGGTEYKECRTCSGSTYTVSVPHPTWTNIQGKSIVLLDAVQLGGINGLNS